MALTRMRPEIGELRAALVAHFDDHHALLARTAFASPAASLMTTIEQ